MNRSISQPPSPDGTAVRTGHPPRRLRRRLLASLATGTTLALSLTLSGSGVHPQPGDRAAPVIAADTSEGYDLDAAAELRAAQCRLNLFQRKGGQQAKAVARAGLNGTPAQLLTAANKEYWLDPAPPLEVAYQDDRATASEVSSQLSAREDVWEESLAQEPPPGYTYTGFQWMNDDNPFDTIGLGTWLGQQFWLSEYDIFHDNQTPVASQASVDAVTAIATSRYSENRPEDREDWSAWHWEMQFMHPMYADDARIFLQSGGFSTSAPAPDTMEFRLDVEALKSRFADCTSHNPYDPHHVLTAETVTASIEWQQEIDGQRTQRDTILGEEAAANADLQVATRALGEGLAQSIIASRLADWQAYWLKQTPASAGLSYPDAAHFAKAQADIVKAQAMALGEQFVAARAAQSAQVHAAKVLAAQNAAYAVADAAGLPRGRGLLYGQQAVQVTQASAAATTAVAKAAETAANATRASAADSKTLMALAQTQAHASAAEFRRAAAETAAAQAKAAADGAAAQADLAAQNAAKAKAAQAKAEAAEKTAKAAAEDAAARRVTAEAQRNIAEQQKDIAAAKRQEAAAAESRAQSQRQAAADALSSAQDYGATSSAKKDAALAAESRATTARDKAFTAERDAEAQEARADAMEARADAVEGTSAAADARTAATSARGAANQARSAATAARAAANQATMAAAGAREAATKAEAAAARAQAASEAAQRDVAVTNAAVKKAHAAAADAIDAATAAAENVRLAKAYADTAKSQADKAQADSAVARTEAIAAHTDAVRTAGYASSTAQAALAARDSALQVVQPANDAIELGSPYKDTDSSAGLAVLTGQAAKTAAEQQAALADAQAAQASQAASEAAALAAQASADAKAAATAAAQAADSASKAMASLAKARASAAEAAAASKAAQKAEANTAEYDRRATADAAAAADAAGLASGYADQADASADDAEADATTAEHVASQAETDATTAEAAAAHAREAADEAEAAADRTEEAQANQSETVRMSDSGPSGMSGLVTSTVGVQDTLESDGICEGTHTGGDVGCEIDVHHHVTGTMLYIMLTCPLPDTSAVDCIGSYTADYIGSDPIDIEYDTQIHINGWEVTQEILTSIATGMVQNFIDCAHGKISGCAWAAAELAAPAAIKLAARYVMALRIAIRSGVGIEAALAELQGIEVSAETMASLKKAGQEALALEKATACVVGATGGSGSLAHSSFARTSAMVAASSPDEECKVVLQSTVRVAGLGARWSSADRLVIEDALGGNLPPGFEYIDIWDAERKIATSVKSLDWRADSYRFSPSAITSQGKQQVNSLLNFIRNGAYRSTPKIAPGEASENILKLAFPIGADANKLAAFQKIVEYGQTKGIKVLLIPIDG